MYDMDLEFLLSGVLLFDFGWFVGVVVSLGCGVFGVYKVVV